MEYIFINLTEGSVFHDLTGINDGNTVAVLGNHAKVVCDEKHGSIVFLFQVMDHFQNLSLDRYIQSCRRFIRDQQSWVAGQCNCDHDTLFHSSGKLVRIVIIARSVDAYHFQHILCLFPSFLFGQAGVMSKNHFTDLVPGSHDGVQRCHRILKDHGDFSSPQLPHFLIFELQQVFSFINDLAICDFSRRIRDQSHNSPCQCGFPGTGFSDQT